MKKVSKRGGKRPGAGMPKGTICAKTHDKLAARAAVRQMVIDALQPLVGAQVANAQGLKYLVYRDKKTGKFERVKDLDLVDQDKERIEVWEKDPSVQAFTDLLNRALDKPAEQEQSVAVSGELKIMWADK